MSCNTKPKKKPTVKDKCKTKTEDKPKRRRKLSATTKLTKPKQPSSTASLKTWNKYASKVEKYKKQCKLVSKLKKRHKSQVKKIRSKSTSCGKKASSGNSGKGRTVITVNNRLLDYFIKK
ncbi:MAG: hypothetical protein KDH96_01790 [Candidatus Riesia sp.]|nr:hypothetical protein [Candidatus Riesia sp.]